MWFPQISIWHICSQKILTFLFRYKYIKLLLTDFHGTVSKYCITRTKKFLLDHSHEKWYLSHVYITTSEIGTSWTCNRISNHVIKIFLVYEVHIMSLKVLIAIVLNYFVTCVTIGTYRNMFMNLIIWRILNFLIKLLFPKLKK